MEPKKVIGVDYASPNFAPRKNRGGLIGWALFIFIGLAVMFVMLMKQGRSNFPIVSLSQLSADIETGNVSIVNVSDDELTYVAAAPGAPVVRVNLLQGMGKDWNFVHWLMADHNGKAATVNYDTNGNMVNNLILPLIPWLLIFFFCWLFFARMLKIAMRPRPVVIVNPEALQ